MLIGKYRSTDSIAESVLCNAPCIYTNERQLSPACTASTNPVRVRASIDCNNMYDF